MQEKFIFVAAIMIAAFVGGDLCGMATAAPMMPSLDYTYRHNMAVAKQVVHNDGLMIVQSERAILLGTTWYFEAIHN